MLSASQIIFGPASSQSSSQLSNSSVMHASWITTSKIQENFLAIYDCLIYKVMLLISTEIVNGTVLGALILM